MASSARSLKDDIMTRLIRFFFQIKEKYDIISVESSFTADQKRKQNYGFFPA
jgi:hypothetical protein